LVEDTPLLVIGWSHKYAEVLAPFGLADYAMAYADLESGSAVLRRTTALLRDAGAVSGAVAENLPDVVASARANLDALAAAVRRPAVSPPPRLAAGSGRRRALLSVSTLLGVGLA